MAWEKGKRVPTNLIVGFLGSGKTTAITKLLQQRPAGDNWSILVNEFGTVSIDHALVGSSSEGVAVEELAGGCACCTLAYAFKPLLAQFIRRTKPDRLILEPSGVSHPAKVVDILRSEDFASVIDLRNIICLIDPKDFDDPRWQETEVFQDQVQLADIVVLNWTDDRDRDLIDRCRRWVEGFDPPKQLILETIFGAIDLELLDVEFDTVRFSIFPESHPLPDVKASLSVLSLESDGKSKLDGGVENRLHASLADRKPTPRHPLRFENDGTGFDGCGWIFHLDDVFNRKKLIDFLSEVPAVVRLKGIFQCDGEWWAVNKAKGETSYAASTWRRDSRLEIIIDEKTLEWGEFEKQLLQCLAR
jgi:G3E family GTPase